MRRIGRIVSFSVILLLVLSIASGVFVAANEPGNKDIKSQIAKTFSELEIEDNNRNNLFKKAREIFKEIVLLSRQYRQYQQKLNITNEYIKDIESSDAILEKIIKLFEKTKEMNHLIYDEYANDEKYHNQEILDLLNKEVQKRKTENLKFKEEVIDRSQKLLNQYKEEAQGAKN